MDENLILFVKAAADDTRREMMICLCCGQIVRSFAPDYAEKVVPVDSIPVVSS